MVTMKKETVAHRVFNKRKLAFKREETTLESLLRNGSHKIEKYIKCCLFLPALVEIRRNMSIRIRGMLKCKQTHVLMSSSTLKVPRSGFQSGNKANLPSKCWVDAACLKYLSRSVVR